MIFGWIMVSCKLKVHLYLLPVHHYDKFRTGLHCFVYVGRLDTLVHTLDSSYKDKNLKNDNQLDAKR